MRWKNNWYEFQKRLCYSHWETQLRSPCRDTLRFRSMPFKEPISENSIRRIGFGRHKWTVWSNLWRAEIIRSSKKSNGNWLSQNSIYANVYKQLSKTSSVDTVIPFETVNFCIQVSELAILELATLSKIHELITTLMSYNSEIANLIRSSLTVHESPTVNIFQMLRFLCNRSIENHSHDVKPEVAYPIPGPLTTSILSRSTLFSGEFKASKVPNPGPDKDR